MSKIVSLKVSKLQHKGSKMAQIIIGWVSVLLAVLSLVPSVIPGVVSVIGLAFSLIALFISLFSINKKTGKKYFNITLFIVLIGVVLINDVLRVWESLPIPLSNKLTLYAVFSVLVLCAIFLAKWLLSRKVKQVKK